MARLSVIRIFSSLTPLSHCKIFFHSASPSSTFSLVRSEWHIEKVSPACFRGSRLPCLGLLRSPALIHYRIRLFSISSTSWRSTWEKDLNFHSLICSKDLISQYAKMMGRTHFSTFP